LRRATFAPKRWTEAFGHDITPQPVAFRPDAPSCAKCATIVSLPQGRFQFSQSSGEIEAHGSYLLTASRGVLATQAEVEQYFRLLREHLERAGVRRLLIDARGQTEQAAPKIREAAWAGLHKLGLERIAYVVGTEEALKATRVNMTGISAHVPIRAFPSVLDAHRWLAGEKTK